MLNGLAIHRAAVTTYSSDLGLPVDEAAYALDHSIEEEAQGFNLGPKAEEQRASCEEQGGEARRLLVLVWGASDGSRRVADGVGVTRGLGEDVWGAVTYQSQEPALTCFDHGELSGRVPRALKGFGGGPWAQGAPNVPTHGGLLGKGVCVALQTRMWRASNAVKRFAV